MQYVEMYNTETSEVIGMSDEFREKVSPVLLRVLMKRGIGMTDEQLLAYYFGMDLITTGAQIFALRSQNNALISQLKEMSANGTVPRTNPVAAQPQTSSQPEPEPQPIRPTPAQEQPEYFEPEEVRAEPRQREEFTQYEVLDDLQPEPVVRSPKAKKSRVVKSAPIPQFGTDTEILNHMEKLAKQEARKSNTGKAPKSTRKKK